MIILTVDEVDAAILHASSWSYQDGVYRASWDKTRSEKVVKEFWQEDLDRLSPDLSALIASYVPAVRPMSDATCLRFARQHQRETNHQLAVTEKSTTYLACLTAVHAQESLAEDYIWVSLTAYSIDNQSGRINGYYNARTTQSLVDLEPMFPDIRGKLLVARTLGLLPHEIAHYLVTHQRPERIVKMPSDDFQAS